MIFNLLKNIIIGCSLLSTLSSVCIEDPRKYVIGPWPGGFGAHLYALLSHIRYCEKHNKIPVAYWGPRSLYYGNMTFNGVRGNVWEYYFEPISNLHYQNGDHINIFVKDHADYFSSHAKEVRHEAYELIKKYIRLKEVVQRKIDLFYQTYMAGKKTIGIHLRGTNKHVETPIMSPEQMIAEALKHDTGDVQYLIASDEQRLFDKMKYLLESQGKIVIYYDCYRSENQQPLIGPSLKVPPPQLGEDVLVEIMLLSKCDFLVRTHSNVSGNALYFNPDLEYVTVLKK